VPSLKDVEEIRITQFMDKIKNRARRQGTAKIYRPAGKADREDVTSLDVAAVLLKMLMQPSAAETRPEIKKKLR